MASKEILLHLAEALKNLSTPKPQERVRPRAADMQARLVQRETDRARRRINDAFSENKTARRKAQEDIKSEAYVAPADPAERSALIAEAAQLVKSKQTPDFLPDVEIVTPEIALYYKTLAAVPPELRTSQVYTQEAMRLYYSTDWASATTAVVRQTREVIDSTFKKAKDMATASSDATVGLSSEQMFWGATDERYDLYRTTRIAGAEEFDVPEDQLKQTLQDPEKARRYALHRKLLKTQKYLDNINDDRAELEKTLTDLRRDLGQNEKEGTEEPLYNENEAQVHVEKLNKKLSEIHAQKEKREEELSGGRRRREEGSLTAEEAELATIIRNAKSKELKGIAQRLLTEYENTGIPEYEAMSSQLFQNEVHSGFYNDVVTGLRERRYEELHAADPNVKPEDVNIRNPEIQDSAIQEHEYLLRLRRIVQRRFEEQSGGRYSHSWWDLPEGGKALEFIKNMDNAAYFSRPDLFDNPSYEAGDFMNQLDKALSGILEESDNRPKDPFNDAIGLYEQADFTRFMREVKGRLRQMKVNDERIAQIMTRFTARRNMKEFAHNLVYIHNSGDLEMLGKFISTLQSSEIEQMYEYVPGTEMAQHIREGLLSRYEADNKYLSPKYFKAEKGGVSQWEIDTRREFDRRLSAGLVRDARGNVVHLEDWQKRNAIELALAIDVADLRFSEMITRAIGGTDWASSKGENLGLDPIHGIFHKFKVKKPACYILYFMMSGDIQSARMMQRQDWSIDRILDHINAQQGDPDSPYGRRLGDIKGLLNISGRLGASSEWGIRRATEMQSREDFMHRGSGFELHGTKTRITAGIEEIEKRKVVEGLRKKYNIPDEKPAHVVADEHQTEVAREMQIRMQKKEIQQDILNKSAVEAHNVLDRMVQKLPLVIIRRMSASLGTRFRDERFRILLTPDILGDRVLRTENGGFRTIERAGEIGGKREIRTFKDLFEIGGENKGKDRTSPENHLAPADNEWQTRTWKEFTRQVDELEGDLGIAQESAVVGKRDIIQEEDWKTLEESLRHQETPLTQEAIDARVLRAKKYRDAIIEAATKVGTNSVTAPQQEQSYLAHMASRIARGDEKFMFTSEDARYSTFEWHKMGDRAILRGVLDAVSAIQGGKGLGDYMETMTGTPDMDEMARTLRAKVFVPIASMDDGTAQQICYYWGEGTTWHYAESPYYSYTGFLGDIAGLGLVQNQLHRWGKYTWLSSWNKAVADATGASWGPNDRYKWIHMLNNLHVLAKHGPIDMWAGGDFTAHHMEDVTASAPKHVVMEYGSYVLTGVPLLVGGVAIKEEAEKESKES